MKKKYLLLLSLFIIALSSCRKGDVTTDQAAIDDARIQAYIKANNALAAQDPLKATTINAIKDPSGIYYQVLKVGTGLVPTAKSTVQVTSTGKLLNGTIFDQSTVANFLLSGTVKGWQIGLLHANAGTLNVPNSQGRILLIIPSALGYGTVAQSSTTTIPANSVLVFTIDLIGFY